MRKITESTNQYLDKCYYLVVLFTKIYPLRGENNTNTLTWRLQSHFAIVGGVNLQDTKGKHNSCRLVSAAWGSPDQGGVNVRASCFPASSDVMTPLFGRTNSLSWKLSPCVLRLRQTIWVQTRKVETPHSCRVRKVPTVWNEKVDICIWKCIKHQRIMSFAYSLHATFMHWAAQSWGFATGPGLTWHRFLL